MKREPEDEVADDAPQGAEGGLMTEAVVRANDHLCLIIEHLSEGGVPHSSSLSPTLHARYRYVLWDLREPGSHAQEPYWFSTLLVDKPGHVAGAAVAFGMFWLIMIPVFGQPILDTGGESFRSNEGGVWQ